MYVPTKIVARFGPTKDPHNDGEVFKVGANAVITTIPDTRGIHEQVYTFDAVFDSGCTNEEVFTSSMTQALDGVLAGASATVILVGGPHSGKENTLFGAVNQPGLFQESVDYLFIRSDNPTFVSALLLSSDQGITDCYAEPLQRHFPTLKTPLSPLHRPSAPSLSFQEDSYGAYVRGLTRIKVKDVCPIPNTAPSPDSHLILTLECGEGKFVFVVMADVHRAPKDASVATRACEQRVRKDLSSKTLSGLKNPSLTYPCMTSTFEDQSTYAAASATALARLLTASSPPVRESRLNRLMAQYLRPQEISGNLYSCGNLNQEPSCLIIAHVNPDRWRDGVAAMAWAARVRHGAQKFPGIKTVQVWADGCRVEENHSLRRQTSQPVSPLQHPFSQPPPPGKPRNLHAQLGQSLERKERLLKTLLDRAHQTTGKAVIEVIQTYLSPCEGLDKENQRPNGLNGMEATRPVVASRTIPVDDLANKFFRARQAEGWSELSSIPKTHVKPALGSSQPPADCPPEPTDPCRRCSATTMQSRVLIEEISRSLGMKVREAEASATEAKKEAESMRKQRDKALGTLQGIKEGSTGYAELRNGRLRYVV